MASVMQQQSSGRGNRRRFGGRWAAGAGALAALAWAAFGSIGAARAGEGVSDGSKTARAFPWEDWTRFELAFESGAGFGLNNPGDYQTLPQLLTLRWAPFPPFRLGDYRLLHQFSANAAGVSFYHNRRDFNDGRRAEKYYFGGGVGARLVLSKPGCPWELSVDGRFYVGDTDSHGPPFGQGQDLTFSAVVTAGVDYRFSPRAKVGVGFLYEHFSNAALSEPEVPNIGLDTIGPKLSFSYAF